MYTSTRAFLNEIIDYAGLFPPAKLPLEPALQNYLRYRKESPYRWMLGKFVCPTPKLPEMLALAKPHPDAALLSITALGQQAALASEFQVSFANDVESIQTFRRTWGSAAVIDSIEFSLPKSADIATLVFQLPTIFGKLTSANLRGFIEVPFTPTWRQDVTELRQFLTCSSAAREVGLKIRTGGLNADAFPSDEQVAFFIAQCRSAKLPWKATAGLHHPRRHWDNAIQTWHHGFLNVFGAGLLARANPLTEADIASILADREGQHFHFDENRFAWKDWSCSPAQIAEFRSSCATTFGSCSFDEPVEDLTAMGLLDHDS